MKIGPKCTKNDRFWPFLASKKALVAIFFARFGNKWFHMKALVQTVVLMCGMPILGENWPEMYQKWTFLASKTALAALFFARFCPQVSQILGMGLAHPTKL